MPLWQRQEVQEVLWTRQVSDKPVYVPLEQARFIRDMSFPHKVARSLSQEYALKVAQYKPDVGKNSKPTSSLKPQQLRLVELAEAQQAYILTRTGAIQGSPWALVFPQELPNEELLPLVVAELHRRGLLGHGDV